MFGLTNTTAIPDHVQSQPCCPFLDPCWNCRWRYEAYWSVVPPCACCPWNPFPQPQYVPVYTTKHYEITC